MRQIDLRVRPYGARCPGPPSFAIFSGVYALLLWTTLACFSLTARAEGTRGVAPIDRLVPAGHSWPGGGFNNAENRAFYENAPPDYLDQKAKERGLDGWDDLRNLAPHLTPLYGPGRHRILEIGAGHGRVLDWLVENFPGASLIACDHTSANVALLRDKYAGKPEVSILQSSVLSLSLDEPVSVALWMWSGFMELNGEEQQRALNRLQGALVPEGLLVVDMPLEYPKDPSLKYGSVEETFGKLRDRYVDEPTLRAMARIAGLSVARQLDYRTSKGIARRAYVLRKSTRSKLGPLREEWPVRERLAPSLSPIR